MIAPFVTTLDAWLTRRGQFDIASLRTLDRFRTRGVAIVTAVGWVTLAALMLVSMVAPNGGLGTVMLIGGLANMIPTYMAISRRHDLPARLAVSTLAAIMPALLVYLLRGDIWQMDAHLYFLAALALLTILCDWRPIALASVLIGLHHVVLEGIAPAWAFEGASNIGRVIVHAVAVALQATALGYLTTRLGGLVEKQDVSMREGQRLLSFAECAQRRAEEALAAAQASSEAAQAERESHAATTERLATERRAELLILAREFEHSVVQVVQAIDAASQRLADSAVRMDDVASDAGREVSDVSAGAVVTTQEMSHVAQALGALSQTIGSVAEAAGHQDELAVTAITQGNDSVLTIRTLSEEADHIGGLLDEIRRIAATTNMLALNAAIEAARAGDAGKGFAVVATEVKNLAADTAGASDHISQILDGVRSGIGRSADVIEQANAAAREVAETASGITRTVTEQRGYASEIERSASRAADSATAIEVRITRMGNAVTEASRLSGEVRSSTGDLSASAVSLRNTTEHFLRVLRDAA